MDVVAESDGVIVARLAWWSNADCEVPAVLDIFDVRDAGDPAHLDAAHRLLIGASAQVVVAGGTRPSYNRRVRTDCATTISYGRKRMP